MSDKSAARSSGAVPTDRLRGHEAGFQNAEEEIMKVLMVITSHDQLGNTGRKTGFWLEELAAPYYVFKDSGADITLASQRAAVHRSTQRATSRNSAPG